jgi:hypothetical protein
MNYFTFSPNFPIQLQQTPQTYPLRSVNPTQAILTSKTSPIQLFHVPSPIASSTTKTPPLPDATLQNPPHSPGLHPAPKKSPFCHQHPLSPVKQKYN